MRPIAIYRPSKKRGIQLAIRPDGLIFVRRYESNSHGHKWSSWMKAFDAVDARQQPPKRLQFEGDKFTRITQDIYSIESAALFDSKGRIRTVLPKE